MAVTCLTKDTLPRFMDRIEKLTPDSKPQFGVMNVVEMLRHLRNAFETALGETHLPNDYKPVRGRLMYLFACYIMTNWPKGKIKAPDYWVPPAEHSYEDERELFLKALKRSVEKYEAAQDEVVMHPMFGPLTLRQWSRLNGIHLDHHLRQFAV